MKLQLRGTLVSKIRQKFAKNLRKLRKARGFTQEELAEKLDISVRYVQQLEGHQVPNVKLDTLATLAKVLNAAPKSFLA